MTVDPMLKRPAIFSLAMLLAAPGKVRANGRHITVALAPAGTANERTAFAGLLATLSGFDLRLAGDRRALRWELQT